MSLATKIGSAIGTATAYAIHYMGKGSNKLKGFLSALYFECECEHFETNFHEVELYTSIENGFFKFQKFLKQE